MGPSWNAYFSQSLPIGYVVISYTYLQSTQSGICANAMKSNILTERQEPSFFF